MNLTQKLILPTAALLVGLILLVPYMRFHVVTEKPGLPSNVKVEGVQAGSVVRNIRFETREGFRPIWTNPDPLRLTTDSPIDFGLGVRWRVVGALIAPVVVLAGVSFRASRSRSLPPG